MCREIVPTGCVGKLDYSYVYRLLCRKYQRIFCNVVVMHKLYHIMNTEWSHFRPVHIICLTLFLVSYRETRLQFLLPATRSYFVKTLVLHANAKTWRINDIRAFYWSTSFLNCILLLRIWCSKRSTLILIMVFFRAVNSYFKLDLCYV